MRFCSLSAAAFLVLASASSAVPLGIGAEYDVVVRRDFTANGTHVHGSTAAGGSLVLKGNMSEFGNQQPAGSGPNVVVNQHIVQHADARVNQSGIVHVGNLTSAQVVNSSQDLVNGSRTLYANTTTVGPTGLDTESAFEQFLAYSDYLAGLTPTVDPGMVSMGSFPNRKLNLSFDGDDSFAVLNLTGNQLKGFSEVFVNNVGSSPSGLVINVDLTGYTGGAFVQNRNGSDPAADWLLWNFYGASSLSIENQFYGTIFAPGMTVIHTNNDLKGAVIADTFVKNSGQIHRHRYAGELPRPPSVPDHGATAGLLLVALGALAAARRWRR